MENEYYNGKRIVRETRSGKLLLAVLSFMMVAALVFVGQYLPKHQYYWGGLIFFTGGGVLMLFQAFDPKNLYVDRDSDLGRQIIEHLREEHLKALGILSLTQTGFMITKTLEVRLYEWTEIETIFGFKQDHFSFDEVCMDIFFTNGPGCRLSEEMEGWDVFNQKLFEHFRGSTRGLGREDLVAGFLDEYDAAL